MTLKELLLFCMMILSDSIWTKHLRTYQENRFKMYSAPSVEDQTSQLLILTSNAEKLPLSFHPFPLNLLTIPLSTLPHLYLISDLHYFVLLLVTFRLLLTNFIKVTFQVLSCRHSSKVNQTNNDQQALPSLIFNQLFYWFKLCRN